MRWFGKSWGAPICDDAQHAETPIGRPCSRCEIPITADDRGLLIPLVADTIRDEPWHIICFLESIGHRGRSA